MEISLLHNQKFLFGPSDPLGSSQNSSMYKGSNKTYVFDINNIQNRLIGRVDVGSGGGLQSPSSRAFQHQQELRQKNQQSDFIKQSLQSQSNSMSGTPMILRQNQLMEGSLSQKRGNSTTVALGTKLDQIKQQQNNNLGYFHNQLPTSSYKSTSLLMPTIDNKALLQKDGGALRQSLDSKGRSYYQNAYASVNDAVQNDSGSKFKVSQRSSMFDFRKQALNPSHQVLRDSSSSKKQISSSENENPYTNNAQQKPPNALFRPLTPIKENEQAFVSNLPKQQQALLNQIQQKQQLQQQPTSSQRSTLSDPDNSILFLDNGEQVVNPTNAKTPPPPMWGEILEEENYDPSEQFYDHDRAMHELLKRKRDTKQLNSQQQRIMSQNGKKLKKKIVYVYESDSDQEQEDKNTTNTQLLTKSLTAQHPYEIVTQSRRGHSIDGVARSSALNQNNNGVYSIRQNRDGFNLPSIKLQTTPQLNSLASNFQKPPLPQPSSQLKRLTDHGLPQSRQIRSGAFQMLPTIGLLNKKM